MVRVRVKHCRVAWPPCHVTWCKNWHKTTECSIVLREYVTWLDTLYMLFHHNRLQGFKMMVITCDMTLQDIHFLLHESRPLENLRPCPSVAGYVTKQRYLQSGLSSTWKHRFMASEPVLSKTSDQSEDWRFLQCKH